MTEFTVCHTMKDLSNLLILQWHNADKKLYHRRKKLNLLRLLNKLRHSMCLVVFLYI
jgi:hypothetical protein